MVRIAFQIYECFIGTRYCSKCFKAYLISQQDPRKRVPSLFLIHGEGRLDSESLKSSSRSHKGGQNQDLNPEILKLTTRADTFKSQYRFSGDLVKIAGSQTTPAEFQIQWDCGGVLDLKHPPDDSYGHGLGAHFADGFTTP